MQLEETKTATTWDSYKDTLHAVMSALQPELIMEWGPGASSKQMLSFKCVKRLYSFEHDEEYYDKWKGEIDDARFELFHEDNKDDYVNGMWGTYDLIFVDGRLRYHCIAKAHRRVAPGGVVMVHDAERTSYHPAMLMYDYVIMTDKGSTATLTNCYGTYKKLLERLIAL